MASAFIETVQEALKEKYQKYPWVFRGFAILQVICFVVPFFGYSWKIALAPIGLVVAMACIQVLIWLYFVIKLLVKKDE